MLHVRQLIDAHLLLHHPSLNIFVLIHHVHDAAVKISVKITPFSCNSFDTERKAGGLLR